MNYVNNIKKKLDWVNHLANQTLEISQNLLSDINDTQDEQAIDLVNAQIALLEYLIQEVSALKVNFG